MNKPWIQHYESQVPATLEYPEVTIHHFLEKAARRFPDNIAINFVLSYLLGGRIKVGGTMTYRQLLAKVRRLARALWTLGIRPGDRVALMLPNSPQFIISYFSTLKIGAVVVPLSPLYTPREMHRQLADAGAETLILLDSFHPRWHEIATEISVKRVIVTKITDFVPFPWNKLVDWKLRRGGGEMVRKLTNEQPDVREYWLKELLAANFVNSARDAVDLDKIEVKPDDLALLQYTSGTNGTPKGAMLTHRNVVANTIQSTTWLTSLTTGGDKSLSVLPFFHAYGMLLGLCGAVYSAGEMIIAPRPIIGEMLQIIERERPTVFPGVPTMYIGIINHADVQKYDLSSIKACISGAAPLPPEVQAEFERITGGRLVEGYGLSEASPVSHCTPVYGERRRGSIGLPFPDVAARVVNLDTDEDVPIGEIGEMLVRGPQVMCGYWNMPNDTARVMEDGWLHTGDIVRMDEDGFFYVVGRISDVINVSGYRVMPGEVERVLLMHPLVREAAAIGIPHAYRGETVKAFVVCAPDAQITMDELIAFCRERLAPYKVPTDIEFRAELPKTLIGKVSRRALRESV